MLNRIKLTNFQQHRALSVDFGAGITALRGSNEAGKSTLIRAICYALFGAKAMPASLDDIVTWGEPTNTMKVELEIGIDGTVYAIKRGKSGAEINYDGGIVTGQTECTAFICRLLKADAGSAPRLMLANQNEIRGALESGPKAATELIEQLSEFDQIDNLIELMGEKLTLGSTANAEAAVSNAESILEGARDGLAPPDVDALASAIATAEDQALWAEGKLSAHDLLVEVQRGAVSALRAQAVERQHAALAVARAQRRLEVSRGSLNDALVVQAPQLGEPVDTLRARIAQLADLDKVRAARAAVEKFLLAPQVAADDRFEGGPAALQEEIRSARAEHQSQMHLQRDHLSAATLAESKISTGSCSTCGQDIGHLPEVAARNKALANEVGTRRAQAAKHGAAAAGQAEYLAALEAIRDESAPRLAATNRYADFVRVVGDTLPPDLEWTGGEIPDNATDEAKQLTLSIARYEAGMRAYDAAQGAAGAARAAIDAADRELQAAEAKLITLPEVDAAPAEAVLAEALALRTGMQADLRAAQLAVSTAERARDEAIAGHQRALRAAQVAEDTLVERRADLRALTFNNGLLKAVRAARPVVADRLWNLVLGAVTRYFSEMRGIKSRVTKDSDGFKVDGHTASTLSGSTLDILGLAIRVALTRTFLPTAPFLVLDEPAAAMDEERTALMLGFLSTCGFPQTLIVTHEDVSEMVADHVVTLGA